MEILRCGRFGVVFHPGDVLQDRGRVLVVLSAELREIEKWSSLERCPIDCCGTWLVIDCREATDAETVAYLAEERAKEQRLAAYQAKVAERRAAYLAARRATPGYPRRTCF